MAEEYGETQVWPVRPPYLVDTETRCGDSGHSVGGSPCRLTIVGGGRRRAGGWAPQALEEIVRLRRLCGSAGRPLNFTVRSHLREFGVAKKSKRRRSAQQLCEPCLTESSCRRLRLALQGAHAATCDFVGSRGARPSDCDQ